MKKPKLTKTQKNFRKKIEKLKRQGKIKDKYGKTLKPTEIKHNPLIIIGTILITIYIIYIVKENHELIISTIIKILKYLFIPD